MALHQQAPRFGPINSRMHFPALDGLRAIAILAVFVLHYGGGSHGGKLIQWIDQVRQIGWLGVDLFFVLSGFLITGVLYDTLNDSRFWMRFYARRSLRIFPIYYGVFTLLAVLTPVLGYQWHAGHLLFLAYLGNFLSIASETYQKIDATRGHIFEAYIGHFWSLCVEEQFYLLWPLVICLLRTRKRIILGCIAFAVLPFALRTGTIMVWGIGTSQRWIYATLPFRMDSLAIGGLLAILLRTDHAERVQRSCTWVFAVGTVLVAAILLLSPGESSPWLLMPGYSLIAVTFAGLIGASLRRDSKLETLLRLKPLRILGKYSYGFYIYHLLFRWVWLDFLVWSMGHLHSLVLGGIVGLMVNFFGNFLLAKLSYDYFESWFLRYKKHFEYDATTRYANVLANGQTDTGSPIKAG